MNSVSEHYLLESLETCNIVHLISADQMNRLTVDRVLSLTAILEKLTGDAAGDGSSEGSGRKPLIITGNDHYFSVGADLTEIAQLSGSRAFDFAKTGQRLMWMIDNFPAGVYAAIAGYCMGGGLDLALACDFRVCSPNAILGHRGASLGLMSGWGGTQRLPRLVGRSRALQMFTAAEKLTATHALDIGLVSEIVPDPLARAIQLTDNENARRAGC